MMRNAIDAILQDVRFTLRALRASPGFALTAVLCLALGIGVNTAVFTMLNDLLFKRLPVPDAARVVRVENARISYLDFQDLRPALTAFRDAAATTFWETAIDTEGGNELVLGEAVTGEYGRMLQLEPIRGRWFRDDESLDAMVISHRVWQKHFHGDTAVIGKRVRLEKAWFTVIGVMPESFRGLRAPTLTSVWAPARQLARHKIMDAIIDNRDRPTFLVFGRLADGAGVRQAQAATEAAFLRLPVRRAAKVAAERPQVEIVEGVSVPALRRIVPALATLTLATVGLVLLIACSNVANLLLARAVMRRREISVRLALGASRGRILQQVLTESLVLASAGGALGLAFGVAVSRLLQANVPQRAISLITFDTALDGRVLFFTLVVSTVAAIVFGLSPAFESLRVDITPALKGAVATMVRSRRFDARNGYIVAQVALSLVLLVVAGLFVRGLQNATRLDPGFRPQHLATALLYVSEPEYSAATGSRLYARVLERVRRMPAVRSAAMSSALPAMFMESDCINVAPAAAPAQVSTNTVTPEYFRTMGIPILTGRDFGAADTGTARPVIIINETLARRYFAGANPLESTIRVGCAAEKTTARIVGVARDANYDSAGEPLQPYFYRPYAQRYGGLMALTVDTPLDPGAVLGPLRRELESMRSGMRIYGMVTMPERLDESLGLARWQAQAFSLFGMLALVLAALGLYGVLSYLVSRRTREIGIRIAIGASYRDVARLVLGHSFRLTAIGIGIGLAASLAVTRFISSLLHGLSPTDPVTFASASALWLAIALAACYFPARRAARVAPSVALRSE